MSDLELTDRAASTTKPTSPDAEAVATVVSRRQRLVLWGAVVAALVSSSGLVASTLVRSPAQQIADTAAPPPNVLTAPVKRTVLTSTLVLRGTFTPGHTYSATPTSVAPSPGNPAGGGDLIITAVSAAQGQTVEAGRVLVEYSGRPIYTLPGAVPAYRDMRPGESGSDIGELQRALQQMGDSCGDPPGYFGQGTKAAVSRFYAHLGYPAPNTGTATQQAVQTAEQAYRQQQQVVTNLQTTGAAAHNNTTAQLTQARQTLHDDAVALDKAKAQDGPIVPQSEAIFLPSFPAVVESLTAQVGDSVPKPLLTLADGGLTLVGHLDPSQSGLVKPGMAAQMLSEATGVQAAGSVATVGPSTSTSPNQSTTAGLGLANTGPGTQAEVGPNAPQGSATPYIPVLIRPDRPWDQTLDGQDVRITITAASTGSAVLAVPEAAISAGADAQTSVTVMEPGDQRHTVRVRAGVSAGGLVEVTPLDGILNPGDQVVVGQ